MDDYKKLFKRELDRYNYLYAKANTKSKKKKIAYDLLFFGEMYNRIVQEDMEFEWDDDIDIINERINVVNGLIRNILDNQEILIKLVENNFKMFLEEEFSVYKDYAKSYHKIKEEMMMKYIEEFFNSIDKSLVDRFNHKIDNVEVFINNGLDNYSGLTYPLEFVDKNIILFESDVDMNIDDARVLVHEMGHDFEFENSKRVGIDNIWNKIAKTPYVEVSSSFFEYAFINYLIENKIYLDDALMLKRRFLNQTLYYLIYILIIDKIGSLEIDWDFSIKLNNEDIVNYANSLFEKINLSTDEFEIGSKINFRSAIIYGLGKILGIYAYDIYKENPKEFLSKFRKGLLEYNDIGMDAFYGLGINKDELVDGKVLKKVLRESK